jgi:hypothetical protein
VNGELIMPGGEKRASVYYVRENCLCLIDITDLASDQPNEDNVSNLVLF